MRLARILTFLLHPVIMPLAGVFILLTYGGWLSLMPPVAKRYIYLITAITTLVIPLLILPLLKHKKIISGYHLSDHRERRIPLLLVAFLNLAGAWILQRAGAPLVFALFLDASSMIILGCTLITWKWKISTHLAGIGGLTGMVMAVSLKWTLNLEIITGILFLLSGLSGFARLKLDQHTPAQVYAGYLLGFGISFFVMRMI